MNANGHEYEVADQRRQWTTRIEAALHADHQFWAGSPQAMWRTPLICFVVLGLLLVLTEWLAVSSLGFRWLVGVFTVITLPVSLAAVGVLIAPWFLLSRKRRREALLALVCSLACLTSFTVGSVAGAHIRRAAFVALAERSRPLVDAVTKYEREHGQPPESLDSLVPRYLPQVPSTGMGAYPKFEYVSGDQAKRFQTNPWAIYVFTPSGGINFDQFLYLPRQNYPEKGYGGSLERIGDWAYVHE
jgi:hypothetical protein